MRFMILLKADKNTEAGALPDEKLLTEMGKYNVAYGRWRLAGLRGSSHPAALQT